jgi:GNAT superfamily N-acetyltransferase
VGNVTADPKIPILILEDTKKGSFLSIEPSLQDDGSMRLFKEFSGTSYSPSDESNERLAVFLDGINVKKIIFEDTRKGLLAKILKRVGYRLTKTYKFPRGTKTHWRAWNEPTPPDMRYLGIEEHGQVSICQSSRRLSLSDKDGAIGEIVFMDYGRFVRAKANRFGSEGFGLVERGRDPSILLASLVKEMIKERKRYLILGPEYSVASKPIHPFPLWHMTISPPGEYEHGCRFAAESDLGILVKLTSEYEDSDSKTALARVMKNLQNPSFRYLLAPGNEGFALIRFMEAAEGMINDLYVSPQHQGKGVGDELTRGALAALSKSCLNIHLNTIYPRAKRLYERYGLKVQYEDLCVALNQRVMLPASARKE